MRKIREVCFCDRCHKELNKDEIHNVTDWTYRYELCEECAALYKEYDEKIKELDKQIQEVAKEYKFGRYLPREDEDEKKERFLR